MCGCPGGRMGRSAGGISGSGARHVGTIGPPCRNISRVAARFTPSPTPPPVEDGSESLPAASAAASDGDEPAEVESIYARVCRTRCRWHVPLAAVQEPPREPSDDKSPVAVDVADPFSLLTQVTLKAVNSIFLKKWTGNLLPAIKIDAIPLYMSSYKNLLPGSWLDDEVINDYAMLLKKRNEETIRTNRSAPGRHFLSTFFYKRLRFLNEYSYNMVRRWAKPDDVFSKNIFFISVSLPAHWVLVVVHTADDAGTISFYNSMGSRVQVVTQSVRQWLIDEAAAKGKKPRNWTITYPECRRQENTDGCGVIVLKNIDYIAGGLDLSRMTKSTAYYHCRMAAELLAGCVGGEG
eukprot:TRINITY_DN3461_c0_g1_i2.p2 TRINITY_DN3461_c0_g1~~TRINITY_DN3461_c0_g1_i2.p2  ORF type:complete len:350 (-),score=58.78 TRINITY_DN3461_c0_g1_i2:360-1409(-)